MRFKFFMLLACVCISLVNQECFSGTGWSSAQGDPKDHDGHHLALKDSKAHDKPKEPDDYHYASIDHYKPPAPQIMDSGRSSITTLVRVQPERQMNDICAFSQKTNSSPLPEKPLEVEASSQVSTAQGEKEADDQPETAVLPGITTSSEDSGDGKKAVGFYLPSVNFIHSAIEENLYELIIYRSLSCANHPDVIQVNKIDRLDAGGLATGMKWLDHCLRHWGKECGKKSEAAEMYQSISKNTSDADFVKIGLDKPKKEIKVLIKNTDGKVLILGVPSLNRK